MSQFDAAYQNALQNPHCRIVDTEAPRSPVGALTGQARARVHPGLDHLPTALDNHKTGHSRMGAPYASKTEARYAAYLSWYQAAGVVQRWLYTPVSLQLGQDCWYRPDFLVEYAESGLPVLIEVKNARYIRDRSLVKPRAAATRFPMLAFVLAVYRHPDWHHEPLPPTP